MPPKAKTLQSRVKEFEDEGMEVNPIKPNEMMCKFCNKRVEWTKKDTIVKHINGLDHNKAKEKWNSPEKKRARQITIEDAVTGAKQRKEEKHQFILDTVDAFVSANIPVLKLDNPAIRNWMSKYIKGSGDLPVSKVLRETYIPEIAKIHENKIKEELRGKEISIYSDETTDKGGRCVYNIMFQTLDPAPQQKLYLVSSTVLDAANAENCARAVMETLQRYEKNIEDVAAFNADSARYMTKCFHTLQGLHEELLHVQCWPHKLHHVGNTFQTTLPELNLAVKHVKKVFLNARKRKNNYLMFLQEKYPDNKAKWKAFPSPIITRWNSWKKAVNYLEEHLDDILQFLEDQAPTDDHNFEENDEQGAGRTSVSIRWLQELSRQEIDKIKVYAEFVKVKGAGVETVIKQLQSKKVPTGHVVYQKLDIIERKMALIISERTGWFENELPVLAKLPSAVRGGHITVLQNAAQVFRDALVKYCRSDSAREFFLSMEALLSPRSLGLTQLPAKNVRDHMRKLPFIRKLSCEDFMEGQAALMDLVKRELSSPGCKSVDVVGLLCAMKASHLSFASACLKALWILPSNANTERSISSYNIVVNDRRRKLKPENAEKLTIVYFNANEYNHHERDQVENDFEFEDVEGEGEDYL